MSTGSLLIWLGVVALAILVNGFFVATEYAVIRLRKSRVEEMVQRGILGANILKVLQSDMDRSIAGAQLGVTLASLVVGWLGEEVFTEIVESALHSVPAFEQVAVPGWVVIALSFLILSALLIIVGEMVPKFIAIRYPEATLLRCGFLHHVFCKFTKPFIWLLNIVANSIVRIIGMEKVKDEQKPPSRAELGILVQESARAGSLGSRESDLLKRALALQNVSVGKAMIPLEQIAFLSAGMSLVDVVSFVVANRHSKYPVLSEDGTVIGIVNSTDMFDLWQSGRQVEDPEFRLNCYVRRVHRISQNELASVLLEQMQARRSQMAVVVDDDGATVGLVTLEDLIEQLIGDIWDEYDTPDIAIRKLDHSRSRIGADVTIFEFGYAFEKQINCQTRCSSMGALVAERLGKQPAPGDSVEIQSYLFTVAEMNGDQIKTLDVEVI